MSGQSFINNQRVDSESGGKAETPTLELQMSGDLLTFRNSAAEIRPSVPCRMKYEELNNLDICSPVFNFKRAFSLFREQQDRLVCDVLLDQFILPGVGNIIKNEALFDSGIRPSSKISELKDEHIHHLLKMTRDFTEIFYRCRRDGKPLAPYYKIYGKRKCAQCEGRVIICRLGDDSDRVTYYCEPCQTNDLSKQRKPPSKNSLLGWVKTGSDVITSDNAQWTCTYCTLINMPTSMSCSACLNAKTSRKSSCSPSSASGQSRNVSSCALLSSNVQSVHKDNKRKSSDTHSSEVKTKVPKLESDVCGARVNYPHNLNQPQASHQNQAHVLASLHPSSKSKGAVNGNSAAAEQTSNPQKVESDCKIPTCPTHQKKCSMKEVRKEGQNKGRWFFTCNVRTCNYFKWADEQFPICAGHWQPCTIRTVMKIGPNNGRRFFTCKLPKNKQCKFFEWAEGYD
ncbi:hypothetical protein DPMN_004929 [Dreissena polymorpha]|nr:hypothetical protein DPMN_004929 [Dreissena polymorpha]